MHTEPVLEPSGYEVGEPKWSWRRRMRAAQQPRTKSRAAAYRTRTNEWRWLKTVASTICCIYKIAQNDYVNVSTALSHCHVPSRLAASTWPDVGKGPMRGRHLTDVRRRMDHNHSLNHQLRATHLAVASIGLISAYWSSTQAHMLGSVYQVVPPNPTRDARSPY